MAVPKKKVSKSRRNMRRYSAAYKMDETAIVISPIDQTLTRPHRVTRAMIANGTYLQSTAKSKKATAQK
jgi:ribosomal protein L32